LTELVTFRQTAILMAGGRNFCWRDSGAG
jgi:hypothetical protein